MHHLGQHLRRRAPEYVVIALAVTVLVIGIPFFVGGVWLMILTGAWFSMLAGAGLCLTGYFLFLKSVIAIWVYLMTFAGTVYWSLSEAGADGFKQMPWLIAPSIILVLLLLTLPVLTGEGQRKARAAPKFVLFICGTLSLWSIIFQDEIGHAAASWAFA